MSARRLATTTAAMALIAWALRALAPDLGAAASALGEAQRTVDVDGPDALVEAAIGLLAWGAWAWGALGLALTAATALPGVLGTVARVAVRRVLPVAARRSAALALGVGLGVSTPLLVLVPMPAAGASTPAGGAPDWPAGDAPDAPHPPDAPVPDAPDVPVPDWPDGPAAAHVVVPGDCLWDLAEAHLHAAGHRSDDAAVAAATQAWWTTNASVIGPDPDLLLPGQVLRAPELR
jgi:hypothetical protein